jgi:hypothetical protein
MAAPFEITFSFRNQRFTDASAGLKAFATQLRRDWDGSAQVLSKEMKDFMDGVAQALAQRHGEGWPGGTGAMSLSKRSGNLVNAIVGSVQVSGTTFTTIEGQIGAPGVPYAKIQETGGTIKATTAKFLAIPLPAALSSNGLPLRTGPRSWDHTFVARSKAGNLIIFRKLGSVLTPLYVLKDQVTIPPRLGMKATLEAGLPYFVDRVVSEVMNAMRKP